MDTDNQANMHVNGDHPARLQLVYMIGTYPGLTTTFVDREIQILRRWGAELQVVAMRRPDPDLPLSESQRALQRGVLYLLPVAVRALVAAHLYYALGQPRTFFGTLFYLLTRRQLSLRDRAKTVLHFGEGVYAAYLLRTREFQEIHAHFLDRAATIALVAGRLLQKPYSLSIHAGADIYVAPVLVAEKIREARHAVSCTGFNRTYLEDALGEDLGDKISLVHHGLDLAQYRPPTDRPATVPTILAVGQLAERKGFVPLVRACRALADQGVDFHCDIVGGGPQYAQLQTLIADLDLVDRVTLWGARPHDEVIERYRHATVFVLPCLRTRRGDVDGFPNVLAEAMAMEVPVISTAISAVPELVVDGDNGLLVPPEDHDALVAAMTRLLGDQELRTRLGTRGRQTVMDRFDVEQNVKRFADVLWPASLA